MKRRVSYPAWLKRSLVVITAGFIGVNIMLPPPMAVAKKSSPVVLDKDGQWLAGFTIDAGTWRIAADLDEIDPRFTQRLIAIEDSRFYTHSGVDLPAIARAAQSWKRAGKAVSGASTITMQLVRQIEPRPRTLPSKMIESARALQYELYYSKDEILEMYLTHTPYGGNVEGIYAATQTYFGKTPEYLTDAEIALLIALPQAPEARRPDRNPDMAEKGRNRILDKLASEGHITAQMQAEAKEVLLGGSRAPIPEMAWITAYGLAADSGPTQTTLDIILQRNAEQIASEFAKKLPGPVNTAITIVDNKTLKVRAHVASADRQRPGGWIDMTDRPRSPGSTLKPFIYGMAMDDGLAAAGSFVHDAPTRFGSYQPENFNRRYHGDVRIFEALRHSLNVPAVTLLDQIGGQRFENSLKSAGVDVTRLGAGGEDAGLAIALGGAGLTVNDVAVLYAALANGGKAAPLTWRPNTKTIATRMMTRASAGEITKILRQAPTPDGRVPAWLVKNAPAISYKTGTSYGFRDAWAAGYTDDWTVVVWVGRPDGAPRPGETGRLAAAPLLFDLISALPHSGTQSHFEKDAAAPKGLQRVSAQETRGPQILFPPEGSEILAEDLGASSRGFSLTAQSETGKVTFYVNGKPVPKDSGRSVWRPEHSGFYNVTAVDGNGLSAKSRVQVLTFDDLANAEL